MYNPQLETFIRVTDAGSFTKAAAQLYISPPAVIKQINLLEKKLGVTLFERTHRGLVLTKGGRSLYQDATYVMRYCRDAVTRAQNAMLEDRHVIRIGVSAMTPPQLLLGLWPRLRVLCPDIKFQLVPFENTPENAQDILAHLGTQIDVVVGIFDEAMLRLRKCAGLEMTREPLCCALSLQHPLAAKSRLTMDDLQGEQLMIIRRGWSRHVDMLRHHIEETHRDIHIVDFDFYNVAVFNRCENSSQLLVVIRPWASVHPLLKILPVDWPYDIPYGLLHAPTPSPMVRQLLQAIETCTTSNNH